MTAVRPLSMSTLSQDPSEYSRLILRDGSTATVSYACPEDREALRDFFAGRSSTPKARRFFSAACPPDELFSWIMMRNSREFISGLD